MASHGIPATYDLDGLRAIHGHLFQDVYEWAGQVRAVDIAKGEPFLPPEAIGQAMQVVAEAIAATDKLRTVPEPEYAASLARLHHVTNVADPFREGNGRTQREFITALAARVRPHRRLDPRHRPRQRRRLLPRPPGRPRPADRHVPDRRRQAGTDRPTTLGRSRVPRSRSPETRHRNRFPPEPDLYRFR